MIDYFTKITYDFDHAFLLILLIIILMILMILFLVTANYILNFSFALSYCSYYQTILLIILTNIFPPKVKFFLIASYLKFLTMSMTYSVLLFVFSGIVQASLEAV